MIVQRRTVRPGSPILRGALLAAAGAVLLGLSPVSPGRAAAADTGGFLVAEHRGSNWNTRWDDDFGGGWSDYNRTLLQIQRESLTHQEEQAREAARQKRRQEIEQDREKAAAEREEYYDAIIETSQAALRAPRGVHYRKPGYTSPDPPGPAAPTVEVGGVPYLYDQGIFWLHQGPDYIVVTAPAGATVAAPPRGAVRVRSGDAALWYFFGVFFSESGGGYTVVRPPPGVSVYYLPDGYTREKLDGTDVFRFGETLYQPIFVQGVLSYQVVGGR